MTCIKKELSRTISMALYQLIDNDYVILDLPYHANIGDILIWEGEKTFLKTLPYKCLSHSSCRWKGSINSNTVILLHGGGNFGDLYRKYQDFRLEIIKNYPNNKIIMFPQSVCYQDPTYITHDSEIISKHNNLYLCARDTPSYEFMKKHFPCNNILLVPDMAFCISDDFLTRYNSTGNQRKLFLSRLDKESNASLDNVLKDFEIRDWPSCERLDPVVAITLAIENIRELCSNVSVLNIFLSSFSDFFADKCLRPYMVNKGLRFVEQYDDIVTTRLHTLIVSVLLNKKVRYVDNISGKLSAYVESWLSNCDNVSKYNYE